MDWFAVWPDQLVVCGQRGAGADMLIQDFCAGKFFVARVVLVFQGSKGEEDTDQIKPTAWSNRDMRSRLDGVAYLPSSVSSGAVAAAGRGPSLWWRGERVAGGFGGGLARRPASFLKLRLGRAGSPSSKKTAWPSNANNIRRWRNETSRRLDLPRSSWCPKIAENMGTRTLERN